MSLVADVTGTVSLSAASDATTIHIISISVHYFAFVGQVLNTTKGLEPQEANSCRFK